MSCTAVLGGKVLSQTVFEQTKRSEGRRRKPRKEGFRGESPKIFSTRESVRTAGIATAVRSRAGDDRRRRTWNHQPGVRRWRKRTTTKRRRVASTSTRRLLR